MMHNVPLLCLIGQICTAADPADVEFFEKRIRPVLVKHCYECHSVASSDPKGGLLLDSRPSIRKGGLSGKAVVPSMPQASLLLEAIKHETFEMPPGEKLSKSIIADFEVWISRGAYDPRDIPPNAETIAKQVWQAAFAERKNWWSFQPVKRPDPPKTNDNLWPRNSIDQFILARLEREGLAPAPPAEYLTLLRRLSFVLTGLPPKSSDVHAIQHIMDTVSPTPTDGKEGTRNTTGRQISSPADAFIDAYVERLLASPHFGEHWARHWMDVVRYTDTYGYEWDIPAKGAWRYRDYLIRAFNDDVPYDQLVREQIAGDLLAQPRLNQTEQINESKIGTMFFQMGEKRHGDSTEFNGIHQEMLDNKIDAFSKAFQGLTISCARCHDHKLDPISQAEYYALAGVFMSSRWVTNSVDLPERNADIIADLKAIKAQLRPELARRWRRDVDELFGDTGKQSVLQKLVDAQKGKLKIDSPLYLWNRLKQSNSISMAWKELAGEYKAESEKRISKNKAHFKTLVDFRKGVPDGWSVDGVGLREITPTGDYVVALTGDTLVTRLLEGGLFTYALSPRLNGAVRTPPLDTISNGHISFAYTGGDFATKRTVFDNAFLTEKQQYLKAPTPDFALFGTYKNMPGRRIYIEFATKSSNPNFPPRVGLGGPCSEEQVAQPQSWFGLTRAYVHEAPFGPENELKRFKKLFDEPAPASFAGARKRFTTWFGAAVNRWFEEQCSEEDVILVNWLIENNLVTNTASTADPKIAALVNRYRAVEKRLKPAWTVNGMSDLDSGLDYRLNIRGDYDQLGAPVPRRYLELLAGNKSRFASPASGRRELAELVASAENPLTARVYVNRIWHWLFGAGLVSTPSNFGRLGGKPSHPELLDMLAWRFTQPETSPEGLGWSTKELIREIVLSRTWRQSGFCEKASLRADPRNRLVHHYSMRRLEAEAIRDTILAVSGSIDTKPFGRPVNPHRSNEDPQKRLFSGPLDGFGRRSLYTKVTIMEPPRFLALFNQPKPKIPIGKRDVANTPAQSLALLNDRFVIEQARRWGRQIVVEKATSIDERLADMFVHALGRKPRSEELYRWRLAVEDLAELHSISIADRLGNVKLWSDIAHAIYNLKEFIYIR